MGAEKYTSFRMDFQFLAGRDMRSRPTSSRVGKMRKAKSANDRYFDRLDNGPKTHKIFAFDIETKGKWESYVDEAGNVIPVKQETAFLLGVIFDGKQFHVYRKRHEMIRDLMGKRWRGYQGWATNLEYDFNALFPHPDYPVQRFKFGSILKLCKLVCRWKEKKMKDGSVRQVPQDTILFHDTLNHWPASVAKMGDMLGIPKIDAPFSEEEGPQEITADLIRYCERDTEVTFRMVEKMQALYNEMGCELKSSIASSAMDLFRRRYMDDRHVFRQFSRGTIARLRPTYYGGRTEVFKKGRYEDINIADVNSMYPAVMAQTKIPILGRRTMNNRILNIEPDEPSTIPCNGEGVAQVTIEIPKKRRPDPGDGISYYPPLPVRLNKVYFPVGKWVGSYTLSELRHAEQCGATIHRVHSCWVWPESDYLFKDYVEDLYQRRLDAKNEAMKEGRNPDKDIKSWMYKLFMNALYGKFGMAGNSVVMATEESTRDGGRWQEMNFGWRRKDEKDTQGVYSNFIWASYITSGARSALHQYLMDYEALYTDTDSCFTHSEIPECGDLGALSFQEHCAWIDIRAPKVYQTPDKVKIKGVPQRCVDPGVFDLTQDFVYRKPLRFSEACARSLTPNTWMMVRKRLTLINDKRRFESSGESSPWDISELVP